MSAAEITLTTIGSRGVRLGVAPAALREAQGGAQIELGLHDGLLIVTLTRDETRWLAGRLLATREPVLRDHHSRGVARGTADRDPTAVPHKLAGLVTVMRRSLGCVRSFAEDLQREREAWAFSRTASECATGVEQPQAPIMASRRGSSVRAAASAVGEREAA